MTLLAPEIRPDDSETQLTVVVVDDHELVRDGLRQLLSQDPGFTVVGEAANAADAVRRVAYDEPDLAIVDIDLPDGSGIDVCRRILQVSENTRVLILTGHADPDDVLAARNAGASGFAIKRIRHFDLVETLRKVARGEPAFGGAPEPVEVTDSLLNRLTRREMSILELVAEGLTNREIAERLFLAEKTVKNYVSNILTKLGMAHRAGAAAHLASARATVHR